MVLGIAAEGGTQIGRLNVHDHRALRCSGRGVSMLNTFEERPYVKVLILLNILE
jgi:hypothetical protein